MKFFNKKEKKFYWYSVKFEYRNEYSNVIFDYTDAVGLGTQNHILLPRVLKKLNDPLHKRFTKYKGLLCNGTLTATPKCYLGYMTNPIGKK
mgnify:CR=1 FL=1